MPEHCASSESLPALEKTFELLAVLLLGRSIRGVWDYRARVLAFGETKHLTVAEYWLNTHQDPFGIHSLTITQNESPASFYKKVFIGLETEHIQLFKGRNSVTMFKHSHKLGVLSIAKGVPAQSIYFNCIKYGGELTNQPTGSLSEWLKGRREDVW